MRRIDTVEFTPQHLLSMGQDIHDALYSIFEATEDIETYCCYSDSIERKYRELINKSIGEIREQLGQVERVCDCIRARAVDGLNLDTSVLNYGATEHNANAPEVEAANDEQPNITPLPFDDMCFDDMCLPGPLDNIDTLSGKGKTA